MRLAGDFSGFFHFLRYLVFPSENGMILHISIILSVFFYFFPSKNRMIPKWTSRFPISWGVSVDQVSLTMVTAPLTFLWDGRWGDESSVPGGRDLLLLDLFLDLTYVP